MPGLERFTAVDNHAHVLFYMGCNDTVPQLCHLRASTWNLVLAPPLGPHSRNLQLAAGSTCFGQL